MVSIFNCVTAEHDLRIVFIAAIISCIGALTFFVTLGRAHECRDLKMRLWLAAAGVTGGGAVWATHFTAMLAHRSAEALSVDLPLTLTSASIAVLAFWSAAWLVDKAASPRRAVMAGFVATGGVAATQYVGMLAVQNVGPIVYDGWFVALAAALGFALSAASFLAFRPLSHRFRFRAAAGLLALAVCTLRFVSMTNVALAPAAAAPGSVSLADPQLIMTMVATVSLLVILLLAALLYDRHTSDLRSISNAALEGLVFVRGRSVFHLNDRFLKMAGCPASLLLGQPPEKFLVVEGGTLVSALSETPVEGRVTGLDGPDIAVELMAHVIEHRGHEELVIAIRDIRERKASQTRLEHIARHDHLTGLANRAEFETRLGETIERARQEGASFALLAINLDRFKAVNDLFGHDAGDQVLRQAADILRSTTRSEDIAARLGGDEFVIVQMEPAQPSAAQALASRVQRIVAARMNPARDPRAVGLSIGVAIFPGDGDDAETLRRNADIALYRAKQAGRGAVCFFDPEMDRRSGETRMLENDLRHALMRGELRLNYQPLVESSTGAVSGYEALLRWRHPVRGEISPCVFIPIAEESGLIVQIGEWVLREACREAALWPDDLFVAVNVSPVQFLLPNLVEMVERTLRETTLPGARLELEITESVLIRNQETVLQTLLRLKALGVGLAMDDFGTGYSSLSALHLFPFDKIKIDRSFTSTLDSQTSRSIVQAIVALGRALGMTVLAEGVETEEQRDTLIAQGCDQSQGFLFGRPASAPQFTTPEFAAPQLETRGAA